MKKINLKDKTVDFLESGSSASEMIKMIIFYSFLFYVFSMVKYHGPKVYAYLARVPQKLHENRQELQQNRYYRAAIKQAKQDVFRAQYRNCEINSQSEWAFKVCLSELNPD